MAEPATWHAVSPFSRIARPAMPAGAQVRVKPLADLAMATVLARKGQGAALTEKIEALYGLTLPDGPRRAANGAVAFVATGPGVWLAVREDGAAGWPAQLAEELAGLASVMDQSDGYAGVRVEGLMVRDVLAKGVFLDLHDRAFPVGSAAGVSVAHLGVILWRREAEAFEMLCFRSYAASFWHWLEESAAEFGLAVEG